MFVLRATQKHINTLCGAERRIVECQTWQYIKIQLVPRSKHSLSQL